MHEYWIWVDGVTVEVLLNDEPRIGDVIEDGDSLYKIEGRRFVGGQLHYAASKGQARSVFEAAAAIA